MSKTATKKRATDERRRALIERFEATTARTWPTTPAERDELAAVVGIGFGEAAEIDDAELAFRALGYFGARRPVDRPALSKKTQAVWNLLESLPPGEARQGPRLRRIIENYGGPKISQSELTSRCIPELKRKGYPVSNDRGAGYLIKPEART